MRGSQKHLPSKMCNILLALDVVDYQVKIKWEMGLGQSITLQEWKKIRRKINVFNQRFSTNVGLNCYKVLHHWYLIPTRSVKMFPGTSDNCWQCGLAKGTCFMYGGNALKFSPFGIRFTGNQYFKFYSPLSQGYCCYVMLVSVEILWHSSKYVHGSCIDDCHQLEIN